MTRCSFLLGLLPIAALAQTAPAAPVNGQCPVCKTQAPPYTTAQRLAAGYCTSTDGGLTVGLCESASRVTRCLACNAAFWQDVATS
jgi:hypothetical protein